MRRTPLRALIFDVDGTLAETEGTHREAFNLAFCALGLDWYWSDALYTRLLAVSGGQERLLHYWRQIHGPLAAAKLPAVQDLCARIHALKTQIYTTRLRDAAPPLRPGIRALIAEARAAGLQLAIATTTSPQNIDALLTPTFGRRWRTLFAAIGDGISAPRKKPDPQVYRQVLGKLGLKASAVLAFEDSVNGLAAAARAGITPLITPAHHTRHQDFSGAATVLSSLAGVHVADLRRWHAAFPTIMDHAA